jgi:hypothetical protein
METVTDVAPVKEGVALIQHKLKNILNPKRFKRNAINRYHLMPTCMKPLPAYTCPY